MKVLHVSYSDLDGGAARAAYRLHQAQVKAGIDSYMLVIKKMSGDPRVISVTKTIKLKIYLFNFFSNLLMKKIRKKNPVKHSLNIFPTGISALINAIKADMINLHWVGSDMISIGEIARLKGPVTWTLHDMWAFSGCEHYDNYPELARYKDNYKPANFGWFDLNALIYKYKLKKWKHQKIEFVTPSNWLANCLSHTSLADGKNVSVIQNCIDHNIYSPAKRNTARELLDLPLEGKVILFGAMSSTSDQRKGYSLLDGAIKLLSQESNANYSLVVFGGEKKPCEQYNGFTVYHLGIYNDDLTLRLLYAAADVYVAPSLQDNLPNTLVESLAVGTPCVAFNIGGMPDLISNKNMGVLVEHINPDELAMGIKMVLANEIASDTIREQSICTRSDDIIVKQYSLVYANV